MVAMSTTSVVGLLISPGGLLVYRGLRNSMMKRGKETTPIELLPPNSWLNYLLAPTPVAFQLMKFSEQKSTETAVLRELVPISTVTLQSLQMTYKLLLEPSKVVHVMSTAFIVCCCNMTKTDDVQTNF
jgi:hypothetical protein